MSHHTRLAVLCEPRDSNDETLPQRAADLAREFGLPLRDPDDWTTDADVALRFADDHLELLAAGIAETNGVVVDFSRLARIRHGAVAVSRKQPLARAFKDAETIVDATAGLGTDAFVLATLGYRVIAIERSPALFALVRDGLQRALDDGRIRRAVEGLLTIRFADAAHVLQVMLDGQPAQRPDAVYLDPMFPTRRKISALPRKTMRIVRAAVGDDTDALMLFDLATRVARRRVVVKRTPDAPPLAPGAVGHVTSKMLRFDIYAPSATGAAHLSLPNIHD